MNNQNKINDELKALEIRFDKKTNRQFYILVVMMLILLGAVKFTLNNFTADVNEAIKLKPAKVIKVPAIRKA